MNKLSIYPLAVILILSAVFATVLVIPVCSKDITNPNILFNLQQLYGEKVQAKNATNKHLTTISKLSLKSNRFNKANTFKTKSFNFAKAALKQFQVQFKVGNSYNVKQFGAKGDGITDDQSAIVQAIARAKGTGLSVYFPPGNYLHSGLILADSVTLFGLGTSSVLTATNPTSGVVQLTGNSPSIRNLIIQYASPASVNWQWPNTSQQADALWVQSANNFSINQVTIANSSNVGIEIGNSNVGTMSNTLVSNCYTYGLYVWGSNNIQIYYNTLTTDPVSTPFAYRFTPYDNTTNSIASQNLTFAYNTVQANTLIANVSVGSIAGLQYSSISNNQFIANAPPAGFNSPLTIAQSTLGTNPIALNILVSGNVFSGNWSVPILVCVSDGSSVNADYNPFFNGIEITNKIINMPASTTNFAGVIALINGNNVTVSSNFIDGGGAGESRVVSNTLTGNISIFDNTIKNIMNNGINLAPYNNVAGSGQVNVYNNHLSNCGISGGDILHFSAAPGSSSYTGLSILNNNYAGPANTATYFIDCLVPSAGITRTITGNTQSTVLPNNIVP